MFNWFKNLFVSSDLQLVREPDNRDGIIAAIGYADLGGVEPWCVGVNRFQGILSLFRVLEADPGWIEHVEERLNFCKDTEHLIGYHFAKDDLHHWTYLDISEEEFLNSRDEAFLNKVWNSLMWRQATEDDTVPSPDEIALKMYPIPTKPSKTYVDRYQHERAEFTQFVASDFYKFLEEKYARIK